MRPLLVVLLCTAVAAGSPVSAGRRSGKAEAALPAAPTATPSDPAAARKVIEEAKARAVSIAAQVDALIALAFPSTPSDPAVQDVARSELVVFGEHAIT